MALTLISPLNLDECARRIAQEIDPDNPFENWIGSEHIIGRIRGADLRLQVRRKYRNSFAPIFFGTLTSSNGHTIVQGFFRMSLPVLIFLGIFGGSLLIGFLLSGQAAILCMFVPLVAIIGAGYGLGKGEEDQIRDFLQATLEGTKQT